MPKWAGLGAETSSFGSSARFVGWEKLETTAASGLGKQSQIRENALGNCSAV